MVVADPSQVAPSGAGGVEEGAESIARTITSARTAHGRECVVAHDRVHVTAVRRFRSADRTVLSPRRYNSAGYGTNSPYRPAQGRFVSCDGSC